MLHVISLPTNSTKYIYDSRALSLFPALYLRAFRDLLAEIAETPADYMQTNRDNNLNSSRKNEQWNRRKKRQPAKEIATNIAIELQKNATTCCNFLGFSCGFLRDLFCRLSVLLLFTFRFFHELLETWSRFFCM
jgi:hypothetical protein